MAHLIGKLTLMSFARLWVRKVRGLRNLHKEKSFIFACNHGSYAEDIILPSIIIIAIDNYVHVYCNDRFYRNFFLRKFLEWGRCIPVRVDDKSRAAKKVNEKAFKAALGYLKRGEPVGIFPEGHRSIDGSLMKAKTGAAKLALTAGVPVIPVGAVGTFEIMPKGSALPKLKRCEINIGKPLYFKKYYGKENNQKVLNEVTNIIMKEIAKLARLKYGPSNW